MKNGGEATFINVDVSDSEKVRTMVAKTVKTYGRLDGAVNNAALTPEPTADPDR